MHNDEVSAQYRQRHADHDVESDPHQDVEFVLTAHPTQVVRRTLLQRYNQIANSLRDGDRKDLTPDEQDER